MYGKTELLTVIRRKIYGNLVDMFTRSTSVIVIQLNNSNPFYCPSKSDSPVMMDFIIDVVHLNLFNHSEKSDNTSTFIQSNPSIVNFS